MPGEPTGMKTSRMPNLELVYSPIPDGAVAQETHSPRSLAYMRPKQWICTSFCLEAMGYSNLPGNYPIMILATDAIYRLNTKLRCQKLMEVNLFAPICMNPGDLVSSCVRIFLRAFLLSLNLHLRCALFLRLPNFDVRVRGYHP